jgi:hypothetical protein
MLLPLRVMSLIANAFTAFVGPWPLVSDNTSLDR